MSTRLLVALSMLFVLPLVSGAPAQVVRLRGPATQQTKAADEIKQAFSDVARNATLSTVRVLGETKENARGNISVKKVEIALGTVMSEDGYILTKASELTEKVLVRLRDGRELPARVVGINDDYDLAMLKIEAKGLRAIAWGDSAKAQVGQWVATTSSSQLPVAVGVLSVGRRKIAGRSAMLGVSLEDANNEGARVVQVLTDTAAEKAGVQVNDIIVAFENRPVRTREELVEAIQNQRLGATVKLGIERDGKTIELIATLGQRIQGSATQPNRSEMMNRMGGELSKRNYGFPTVLQHDTVLRPQDCGGPLVNLKGEVVGINIARAGRTESYALPADVIKPLMNDLKAGKTAPPATRPTTRPTTRP